MTRINRVLILVVLSTLACTRGGEGKAPGPLIPTTAVDWEAVCLKATSVSCVPYVRQIPNMPLAECCRLKCRAGDRPSCQAFFARHPVTTAEFWSWPKAKALSWEERLGMELPVPALEYLALEREVRPQPANVPLAAEARRPELVRDLLWAWKNLPEAERKTGEMHLIGVAVVRELGSPVEAILVREQPEGRPIAGFLALDWADTVRPWQEWLKLRNGKTDAPAPVQDRRATLRELLRLGIRQIETGSLSSADGGSAAPH